MPQLGPQLLSCLGKVRRGKQVVFERAGNAHQGTENPDARTKGESGQLVRVTNMPPSAQNLPRRAIPEAFRSLQTLVAGH